MIFGASQENPQMPVMARAVVRSNNDPDKRGRVQVEYPWFQGQSAQLPSEWARICRPYASSESGSWFLPEVGDEVMVYFENGNLDYPIVMGSLYSGKNGPPSSGRQGDLNDDNENNLKFIKTRSGHLLCFDDSNSNQAIVLKDKDNRRLEINTREKKVILSDDQDNSVTIDGPEITIKNNAGDKVVVKSGSIVIHSAGEIKLGESASEALVLGNSFMQHFNTHCHPVPNGTSSPPAAPMMPTMLSMKVKTS